jgi:large subunit ribosomal protein L9
MKVILLKELKGRGGEGDVIDVARGYANNYLLRQGYAVLATKGNLKQLEGRRASIAKREEVRIADAEALKAKLDAAKITIAAQVGDEDQLFGSVTNTMVAEAIAAQLGEEIDRRRIELGKPIKVAGEHKVTIALYRSIKAELTVLVGVEEEPEVEEAPEAAETVETETAEAVEPEAEAVEEVAE